MDQDEMAKGFLPSANESFSFFTPTTMPYNEA